MVEETKKNIINNTLPEKDGKADAARDERHEYGGPKGPEPTRYGDWENKGQCIDF